MFKLLAKQRQILTLILDIIVYVFAAAISVLIRSQSIFDLDSARVVILNSNFVIMVCIFVMAMYISGLYNLYGITTKSKNANLIITSTFVTLISGLLLYYLFPSDISPKVILVIHFFISTLLLIICRSLIFRIFKVRKSNALLIGSGTEFDELREYVNLNNFSYKFIDHITLTPEMFRAHNVAEALHNSLKENKVNIIVADVNNDAVKELLPYMYAVAREGIRLYDMKQVYASTMQKMPLSAVGYFWLFENVSLDMKLYELLKRAIDIIVSLPLAVLWIVIHPFVSFLIKREDGGEVFIVQERIGKLGKLIKMRKYRTMSRSDNGVWLKDSGNTNKVTKIGYYLRKSRIDELPQLTAILKGDVSLIGPRPDMIEFYNRLVGELPYYSIRYSVAPGMSGWAQVMQDKPPQSIEETIVRLQYDLYYIKNRSLFLDIIIGLKTVRTLLSRSGM